MRNMLTIIFVFLLFIGVLTIPILTSMPMPIQKASLVLIIFMIALIALFSIICQWLIEVTILLFQLLKVTWIRMRTTIIKQ